MRSYSLDTVLSKEKNLSLLLSLQQALTPHLHPLTSVSFQPRQGVRLSERLSSDVTDAETQSVAPYVIDW